MFLRGKKKSLYNIRTWHKLKDLRPMNDDHGRIITSRFSL